MCKNLPPITHFFAGDKYHACFYKHNNFNNNKKTKKVSPILNVCGGWVGFKKKVIFWNPSLIRKM